MIWFTSDLHLNHKNICRGESTWDGKKGTRNFNSVTEMNRAIMKSLECVEKGDTLYILGDVVLCIENKIEWINNNIVNVANASGYEVVFIRGNHDWSRKRDEEIKAKVCDIWEGKLEIPQMKRRVMMCHYPMVSWTKMGKGSYMLHGHCHGNLDKSLIKGRMLDVGWDIWGRPLSLLEVARKLDVIAPMKTDHHVEDGGS